MAVFSVQTDDLRSKASALNQHAEEFDTICAKLKAAATSMGTAYESDDNKAYVSNIEAFCVDLKNLSNRLRNASAIITAQADDYDDRESNNTVKAKRLPH